MAPKYNDTMSNASERTPLLGTENADSINKDAHNERIVDGLKSSMRSESNATTVGGDIESCSPNHLSKTVSHNSTLSNTDTKIPPKIIAILSIARIGTFLSSLDFTILATLSGPISSSFNSMSLLPWLAIGYSIASASCSPISGKLTDIYGRRNGLLFCNTVFGIGTLLCGLASTTEMFIAGRVIAGIGAAGNTTIATFLTSDFVPLRQRPLWQTMNSFTYLLGTSLGGFFGGWITDTLSWRWAFLIQVPVVVLSIVLVWFLMDIPSGPDESNKPALSRVDFLGALLILVTLVLFLLGINTGGNQLPWSHPLIISSLAVSGLTAAIFVYVETQPSIVPEPIVPVSVIIQSRSIYAALFSAMTSAATMMIMLYYFPIFLEIRGDPPTKVSYRIIPVSAATALATVVSSIIMKLTGRYKSTAIVAGVTCSVGAGLLLLCSMETPGWSTYLIMIPTGIGYGLAAPPLLIGLMAATDQKNQAPITAAQYALRTIGQSVGLAVGGAIVQNVLMVNLQREYGALPDAHKIITSIRNSLEWVHHPPAGIDKKVIVDAYMTGIKGAFGAGLVMAVLSLLSIFLMKEFELRKKL